MTTARLVAAQQQQAARMRAGLPFAPACLAAPRAGAPGGWQRASGRFIATLPQRTPHEQPLTLAAAGFPTLVFDHERGVVVREAAELELGRVGLAYLRNERAAGAPPQEQQAAIAEQLRQLEQARAPIARAEISGPISLALQLVDDQERPLAYDPAMREALAQQLTLRAEWLHEQISAHLGAAMVCLDEPFLDALASPFGPLDYDEGLALLARTLAEAPAPRGLCVAGATNWATALALPAEIIFFDAYEHEAGLIQAASAVTSFLDRGGVLGWGLVPNDPAALTQERVETLARRFESAVDYLAAAGGVAPERVRAAALISTSGGLAHLPPPQAAQAAALCGDVSAHLRAKYQLDSE